LCVLQCVESYDRRERIERVLLDTTRKEISTVLLAVRTLPYVAILHRVEGVTFWEAIVIITLICYYYSISASVVMSKNRMMCQKQLKHLNNNNNKQGAKKQGSTKQTNNNQNNARRSSIPIDNTMLSVEEFQRMQSKLPHPKTPSAPSSTAINLLPSHQVIQQHCLRSKHSSTHSTEAIKAIV
jgi:hypothetical protein